MKRNASQSAHIRLLLLKTPDHSEEFHPITGFPVTFSTPQSDTRFQTCRASKRVVAAGESPGNAIVYHEWF
jgi:hypothetical protein